MSNAGEINRPVRVVYRNHRGEVKERRLFVESMWYGHSSYHDGEQFFVRATDTQRPSDGPRDFAQADFIAWGDAKVDAWLESRRGLDRCAALPAGAFTMPGEGGVLLVCDDGTSKTKLVMDPAEAVQFSEAVLRTARSVGLSGTGLYGRPV